MSLILNAFLKVPMQFLILAVGVLMFVSYHFIKPPLNFNEANRNVLTQKAGSRYAELEKRVRRGVSGEKGRGPFRERSPRRASDRPT